MNKAYVDLHLPGETYARRVRLLAEASTDGSQPGLEVYDTGEYLMALKRHGDGAIEHEIIWVTDDQFDGRCQPVHPLPQEEIRGQLRRFFGDDPRGEEMLGGLHLR